MTDQQLFGVLARIVGLLMGIYGILEWFVGVAQLVDPKIPHHYSVGEDLLFGLIALLIALILVRYSDSLTEFAYPRDKNSN